MKKDDPRRKNLRSWGKGVSGNPLGAKLHNPQLRAVRRLTKGELAEVGSLLLEKDLGGLRRLVADPSSSALKVWIATIAAKGIKNGNAKALDLILNRIVGKPTEHIELTGREGGPVRHLVGALTPEQRIAELKRLRKLRREAGDD